MNPFCIMPPNIIGSDGMARIYHPVAQGLSDPAEPLWGQFLKDDKPCPW